MVPRHSDRLDELAGRKDQQAVADLAVCGGSWHDRETSGADKIKEGLQLAGRAARLRQPVYEVRINTHDGLYAYYFLGSYRKVKAQLDQFPDVEFRRPPGGLVVPAPVKLMSNPGRSMFIDDEDDSYDPRG